MCLSRVVEDHANRLLFRIEEFYKKLGCCRCAALEGGKAQAIYNQSVHRPNTCQPTGIPTYTPSKWYTHSCGLIGSCVPTSQSGAHFRHAPSQVFPKIPTWDAIGHVETIETCIVVDNNWHHHSAILVSVLCAGIPAGNIWKRTHRNSCDVCWPLTLWLMVSLFIGNFIVTLRFSACPSVR